MADIREKTKHMGKKEACSYLLNYYWYHALIAAAILALIFLFGTHYLFGRKPTLFSCVIVNQEMDAARDQKLAASFAESAGISEKQVMVDSNYNFSFGDLHLSGVNESSYEKFFFLWRNGEMDAVILSESFYQYCKEMGGEFKALVGKETEGFERYMDGEDCTAVVLDTDHFMEKACGKKGEKLLLAFPANAKHTEERGTFLSYLSSQKGTDWRDGI